MRSVELNGKSYSKYFPSKGSNLQCDQSCENDFQNRWCLTQMHKISKFCLYLPRFGIFFCEMDIALHTERGSKDPKTARYFPQTVVFTILLKMLKASAPGYDCEAIRIRLNLSSAKASFSQFHEKNLAVDASING